MLFSKEQLPPIDISEWASSAELRVGSLVMILMVPPMADAPNRADPPPRTTSTRSIMLAGICSKPYTPVSAEKMGRESINICE